MSIRTMAGFHGRDRDNLILAIQINYGQGFDTSRMQSEIRLTYKLA
jgi:hypothetical protein